MKELPTGVEVRGKSLRISFMYGRELCRETIKLPPTPANAKYAERKRSAVLHEIEKGIFVYAKHFPNSQRARREALSKDLRIADRLRAWLESIKKETRYSTWIDYSNTVENVLIPANLPDPQYADVSLGDLRMGELTPRLAKAWRDSLTCGPKRVNNIMIPLRAIYDEAYEDEEIERNPFSRVHNLETVTREADPFEPEEVEAILGAAPEGQCRNFLQFAFAAGLRTGELIGVDWGSVDWKRGTVRVDKSVVRGREEVGTKTRAGIRDLALVNSAREALQAQRAYTQLIGARVFHNPRTGRPWRSPAEIHKTLWKPALEAAGVRYRNQYQTRHTFASTALMGGFSELRGMEPMALVMWLTRQMGHSNPQMIFSVYGKYLKSFAPQGAAELG